MEKRVSLARKSTDDLQRLGHAWLAHDTQAVEEGAAI